MRCENPLDHEPHEYLADSEAATLSPCGGGPRLHTEEEVGALQAFEVRVVLKGLLRNLENVLAQRTTGHHRRVTPVAYARREGEIWGLKLAIQAVKRRIR